MAIDDKEICQGILRSAGVSEEVIRRAWVGEGSNKTADRDNEALGETLRVLFEQGVSAAQIGRGLGCNAHYLLGLLGLKSSHRQEAPDLPGELWRRPTGFRHLVSNMARVKSPQGRLIATPVQYGKPRARFWRDGRPEMVTLANLVAAAWLGEPYRKRTVIRHLNGDVNDCRPENLSCPLRRRNGVLSKKTRLDFPWTAADDRELKRAGSLNDAINRSRHDRCFTIQRVKELGVQFPSRRGKYTDLSRRDLDAVRRCVRALEEAQVPDRAINLGLSLLGQVNRSKPEERHATEEVLIALYEAEVPRIVIAEALGWSQSNVSTWFQRIGLPTNALPEGWRSRQGPPELIEGEEWRPIHGWGYQVSSHGRVLGKAGDLLATFVRSNGTRTVCLITPDGARTTSVVARLVLAAFRPEMAYSFTRTRFLNEDRADVKLANMAPLLEREPDPATPGVLRAADGARGSVPYFDPLWAAAEKALPRWVQDDAMRADLISDTVLMMIEGEAGDAKKAMAAAIRRYNDLTGNDLSMFGRKGRSLDAEIPGTDGLTLGDTISSDMDRL